MLIISTNYLHFLTHIIICTVLLFYIYKRTDIFYLISMVDNITRMLFNGNFGLKYITGLFHWTQFVFYVQCDILAGNIVKFVSKTSKQRKNETRHRRENSRHFSSTQWVEILYQFYGTKRTFI